jgi:hypothetical protein
MMEGNNASVPQERTNALTSLRNTSYVLAHPDYLP